MIEVCEKCNHRDACKNSLSTIKDMMMPPLTQRGDKLPCWACNHSAWRINHAEGTRTCDVCRTVNKLNDDSVQIKHQRG